MGNAIRIDGVNFVDSPDDLIVQKESQVIRLPINLIEWSAFKSRSSINVLRRKNGNWNKCPRSHFQLHLASSRLRVDKSKASKDTDRAPTDVTLPVEICLARGSISAREFPVNFVHDVAHSDKSGYNTIPTARLH